MLKNTGSGVMDMEEVGVSKGTRDSVRTGGDRGVPSGVLVGVSPVGAGNDDLDKRGLAEHLKLLHVLVVDDDEAMRKACCQIALSMGFGVVLGADGATTGREILKDHRVDLLLLDLKMPGGGGLALLEQVKALYPDTAVIVMTAFATVSSAVQAMRIGAGDYLTKPFALEQLTTVLERTATSLELDGQSRLLRERLRTQQWVGGLVGRSPEMEKLFRILSKVTHSTHPVLIFGESGTGKELIARTIHFNGPNAKKPFVPVDCGALAPALIEAELFGHMKGAFAGADRTKDGLLSAAEGGTVFLDEIADLPLDLQAKLLRALQEREVRPAGSTMTKPITVRVLAATNRDLTGMVEQGRFRKDLYFRLNVVNLKIPPLRNRREDIPVLATYFLEKQEKENGVVRSFSDTMLRVMTEYDWPGNVRELENVIERACTLSSGPLLHTGDLPAQLQNFRQQQRPEIRVDEEDSLAFSRGGSISGEGIVSIAEMEKHAILGTIRQLKGDKLMAARMLGIGKTTLYRKLKEYGISDISGDATF
jgi:DNA-binding NtrC family response regulator